MRQEAEVILQRNIIMLILRITSYPSSGKRATRTFQLWSMRISHIGIQKLCYDTRALLSCNKQQCGQLKVIISYEYVMKFNTFLFQPADPKIVHSQFGQA